MIDQGGNVPLGGRHKLTRWRHFGVRRAQLPQVTAKTCAPSGSGVQAEVDPRPSLRIVPLSHRGHRFNRGKSPDIRPPITPVDRGGELDQMGPIQTAIPRGNLKVFGQSLIEPQRHRRYDGMQVRMGHFMPQVFRNPVTPECVNSQPPVAFDEEGTAVWEFGEVFGHIGPIGRGRFKDVNVNRCLARWQIEDEGHRVVQGNEFIEQGGVGGEPKVAVDQQRQPFGSVERRGSGWQREETAAREPQQDH